VIVSFDCKETEKIFHGTYSRKFPADLQSRAMLKLQQIHAASSLQFLRIPPSNRLEPLSGNLKGFHSIRINQQWRIIFRWSEQGASVVKITDYH
jgi:proteic killer suppression protein